MKGTLEAEKNLHKIIGEKSLEQIRRKPYGSPVAAELAATAAQIFCLFDEKATVLEMGCGDGWLCGLLAKRGNEAIGVDINPAWIDMAKAMWGATFYCHDFLKIRLSPVDVVIWSDSFHHSLNKRASLRASWDALKPGGLLIINEPGLGFTWQPRVRKWTKQHGVTDRDCPPIQTIALGWGIGFRQPRVYPHLNTSVRALRGPFPALGMIALCLGKYFHGCVTMRKPV